MPTAKVPLPEPLLILRCQRSFKAFVREFFECVPGVGRLVWNWHLDLLCDELQEVADRVKAGLPKKHDLIVNICFGTSKSMITSVLFQAWVWASMPEARFLSGTHTDSLVLDLSVRCKDVIKCEKYQRFFPNVKLRYDRGAKEDWANTVGGERKCCTVGGVSPMGRHVHFIIIDDPIDPKGARSETEVETAARFMNEVIPSRMVDKEVVPIILVMQRLHPRDPTYVMLTTSKREGTTPVRHICLPGELCDGAGELSPSLEELKARYEGKPNPITNEPMVVYEDGLMDKFRLSRRVLSDYRARLMAFGYAGQVLQNPVPAGGGRFKQEWFSQHERAAPYEAVRVRAWDRAATSEGGAATAGVLMARTPDGRLFVEDVVWGQWEPHERNEIIVATAKRDRLKYGPKNDPTIVIEAERGSTGMESFQHLARRLMGYRIREAKTSANKDARAEPWADQLAAMNVWFVVNERMTWDFDAYVQEHVLFRPDLTSKRMGGFKDRVDASSHALAWLSSHISMAGAARVLAFRKSPDIHKRQLLKLVACPPEMLDGLHIEDHPTILIRFVEPELSSTNPVPETDSREPVEVTNEIKVEGSGREDENGRTLASSTLTIDAGGSGEGNGKLDAGVEGASDDMVENDTLHARTKGEGGSGTRNDNGATVAPTSPFTPVAHLVKNMGYLELKVADIDPKDYQDKWTEKIPAYGKLPEEVMMSREQGKKLWAFVTKKWPVMWEAAVIVGAGGLPLSASRALAVGMGLKEAEAVYDVATGGFDALPLLTGPVPNQFVYDLIKATRSTVV